MKFILKCIKGFLRFVAFLLLLVSAVAVAAAIAVKVLVTPESLRTIFIDQLQEALHRPVQIQGVRFLITQGIQVRGLKVLESSDFPGSEFISSDVVLAKYNWKSLLRRRLEINELQLISPRIQLVRNPDGRWNIEDVFTSSSAAKSGGPSKREALPVALAADMVSIDDGVMVLKDIEHSREYSIHGFNLRVKGFNETRPFALRASFENADQFGGALIHSKVSSEGFMELAGLSWEQASLVIDRLRVEVEGRKLSGTLTLKNFHHPSLALKARAQEIDSEYLSRFKAKLPPGLMIPPGSWQGSMSFPTATEFRVQSLHIDAPPLQAHVTGSLKWGGGKGLQYWSNVTFPQFPLTQVSAVWRDGGKYGLTGGIAGDVTYHGQVTEPSNQFSLDKISLALKNFGGTFLTNYRFNQIDADLTGANNLQSLVVNVAKGKSVIYGTALSDLDAKFSVNHDNLDLEKLNLGWNISHIKLKGRIKGMNPPTDVALDGSIDKVKLDQLIDTINRLWEQSRPANTPHKEGPWARVFRYSFPRTFPSISGHLKVGEVIYPNFENYNFEGTWNLRGIATGLRKVSGDIQVGFGPGRVFSIPALESDNKILRVVFLPFVFMHKLNNLTVISLNTAYPKTLDYNRIYGEYHLNNGLVDVRLFHVDSAPLVAYADGTVDFPKEKINLHILTRLNQARGSLPEYLTDQKGRPSIGFFVENNLNNPDLRIDYHKMEEDAIEKSLRAGMQRSHGAIGSN